VGTNRILLAFARALRGRKRLAKLGLLHLIIQPIGQLRVAQLAKEFPAFDETFRLIAVFRRVFHSFFY
jgi:hypothetical protein